jgi:hypothetical protein
MPMKNSIRHLILMLSKSERNYLLRTILNKQNLKANAIAQTVLSQFMNVTMCNPNGKTLKLYLPRTILFERILEYFVIGKNMPEDYDYEDDFLDNFSMFHDGKNLFHDENDNFKVYDDIDNFSLEMYLEHIKKPSLNEITLFIVESVPITVTCYKHKITNILLIVTMSFEMIYVHTLKKVGNNGVYRYTCAIKQYNISDYVPQLSEYVVFKQHTLPGKNVYFEYKNIQGRTGLCTRMVIWNTNRCTKTLYLKYLDFSDQETLGLWKTFPQKHVINTDFICSLECNTYNIGSIVEVALKNKKGIEEKFNGIITKFDPYQDTYDVSILNSKSEFQFRANRVKFI